MRLQCAGSSDDFARFSGSGEKDAIDSMMFDDRRSDVAETLHDVHDTRRQSRVTEDLSNHRTTQWRILGRLPDDRIACTDDVRQRNGRDVSREVVRRNHTDHAEGTVSKDQSFVGCLLLSRRERQTAMSENLLRCFGVGGYGVLIHLFARVRDCLTDFVAEHQCDRLGTLKEQLVNSSQNFRSLDDWKGRPRRLGIPCCRHCAIDIRSGASRYVTYHFTGMRRPDLEGSP